MDYHSSVTVQDSVHLEDVPQKLGIMMYTHMFFASNLFTLPSHVTADCVWKQIYLNIENLEFLI